jgi:triphosphatase
MQEIELKFQIPEHALAAVRKALKHLDKAGSAPLPLKAAYFDTPDRQLAAASAALRVRQEGDDWVQTIKAGGKHAMIRLEDNRPATPPKPGAPIRPKLSLHEHPEVRATLQKALNWDAQADPAGERAGLIELYRTDIQRTRAHITVNAGTPHEGVVELALDLGHIHAGPLSVPVRELEIELVSGHPMAVIDAGRDWVKRHGLWLDTQTKAHRGDRLARQAAQDASAPDAANANSTATPAAAPVLPRPAKLKHDAQLLQAWTVGLEGCLAHVTGNQSELATEPAQPELVAYQWRQALRRLRVFGRLWANTALALPDVTLERAEELTDQIGHWRDIHVLQSLPQALREAGGPELPLPRPATGQHHVPDLVTLARSQAATDLCLDLITCLLTHAELNAAEAAKATLDAPFQPWLIKRLRKWQKACMQDAHAFRQLDDAQLHRLRKRGKRIRLAANLYASLWPEPRLLKHEQALKAALDALGDLHNEVVAEAWYTAHAQREPRALFGQGWLAGRRQGMRRNARKKLEHWMKVRTPW